MMEGSRSDDGLHFTTGRNLFCGNRGSIDAHPILHIIKDKNDIRDIHKSVTGNICSVISVNSVLTFIKNVIVIGKINIPVLRT
jgi:hypothetical protein